ncbi:MAG: TIGR02221 family CRISPR-associated protein [Ardenticatenales bacterium]|nr:TIGR02221 family CRISPR-associated protein [Ardenticatenales bacterium]
MKKILTFLGLSPKETLYRFEGSNYKGEVFGVALREFVAFDEMVVFVTKQAKLSTYPVLEQLKDERIRAVNIPTGETTDEQWAIFESVTGAVDDGDEVVFDITHGLRSLPFLVFLAAAFLKSAKNVTIAGIYYGALELQKTPDGYSQPAPVIDLTEFVSLLDWLSGSEQFIRTGNAAGLVRLLRDQRPNNGTNPESRKVGMQISDAAKSLEETSRALRLTLPDQAMQASETLQGKLGVAADTLKQYARPFTLLSRKVAESYAPLAMAMPRDPANQAAALLRERQLINWYLDRNLFVQAMAVAREWLVSWVMLAVGYGDIYKNPERHHTDKALGKLCHQLRQGGKSQQEASRRGAPCTADGDLSPSLDERLNDIPKLQETLRLFSQISDLRNQLLHAGKRPQTTPVETLEKNARKYCEQLAAWPVPPTTPDA